MPGTASTSSMHYNSWKPSWCKVGVARLASGSQVADLGLLVDAEEVVLAAEELRYAAQAIGKISWAVDVEDVLDSVFRDFCIGK